LFFRAKNFNTTTFLRFKQAWPILSQAAVAMVFNNSFRFFKVFPKRIFIFSCLVIFLQIPAEANGARPVNGAVLRGIECLYDWRFSEAEGLFKGLVAQDPADPTGYFYLAMVSWSRLASGFWTKEVVREYGKRIDKAISIAKRKVRGGKASSFDYFYLGGALGYKGRFRLMKKKYLSSFLLAIEAIEALNTSKEMDPENKDVLLGLGLFDYYTARFQGVLKFLTYLFVNRGNKEKGLRELHEAAQDATYSSTEAKSMLLHIYLFLEDENHDKALIIARELASRFRNNPKFQFLEGISYLRLKMDSRFRETVESLKREATLRASLQEKLRWKNRSLYLAACYDMSEGRYKDARERLNGILAQADPLLDPAMIAWPLLKIGMTHDLEGNREKSLEYYKTVLKLENGAGAQFLAEKYSDEPVEKRDLFLVY